MDRLLGKHKTSRFTVNAFLAELKTSCFTVDQLLGKHKTSRFTVNQLPTELKMGWWAERTLWQSDGLIGKQMD